MLMLLQRQMVIRNERVVAIRVKRRMLLKGWTMMDPEKANRARMSHWTCSSPLDETWCNAEDGYGRGHDGRRGDGCWRRRREGEPEDD